MPLTPTVKREPIHHREIHCRGYLREDGLWDIEGHLRDTKAYAFHNHERGDITPGDPIHDMWLRITVDDGLTVVDAEASTDGSPFGICGNITPVYKELIGLRIGPGWTKQTKSRFGGIQGCTHITELLGPVATTAFQTVYPYLARKNKKPVEGEVSDPAKPPPLLNTCHAFAAHSPIVQKRWPDFYKERPPEKAKGG
ncbi:MAG: DUF2889 domain-containing protein [Alphaproteobacteria bacterium]|nr:DUF2889 domain-containing protein [Alphaproteobacteria bacterium SS10]